MVAEDEKELLGAGLFQDRTQSQILAIQTEHDVTGTLHRLGLTQDVEDRDPGGLGHELRRYPILFHRGIVLDAAKIPAEERMAGQPKELVAVLGSHRQRVWTYPAAKINNIVPSPDGFRPRSHLYAVTAIASYDVWAVGDTDNGTVGDVLIEHWDGSTWTYQTGPSGGGHRLRGGNGTIRPSLAARRPTRSRSGCR